METRPIAAGRRLLAATLALATAGCAREPDGAADETPRRRVERGDIVQLCREDGVLLASRIIELWPEVPRGRLVALDVKEGAVVHAGDLLARFDSRHADGEIRIQQARVEATRLRLDLLRALRASAEEAEARQAQLKAAQDQSEARRGAAVHDELFERGLCSAEERDRMRALAAAADLAAEAADARVRTVREFARNPEIADLEVALAEAEAALGAARRVRDACDLKAPFDGIVVMINERVTSVGDALGEVGLPFGDAREALLTIADLGHMKVLASFFENDMADLAVGQKALVRAAHVPGRDFKGTVASISQLGKVHGRTSTVSVEVKVDNPDYLLRPGLTAQVEIRVAAKEGVLTVPVEYVRHGDGGTWAWRLRPDGKPERADVTTGISDGRRIEIVQGLAEGDELGLY